MGICVHLWMAHPAPIKHEGRRCGTSALPSPPFTYKCPPALKGNTIFCPVLASGCGFILCLVLVQTLDFLTSVVLLTKEVGLWTLDCICHPPDPRPFART